MKTKYTEDQISCRSCCGRIATQTTKDGESWEVGTVLTPNGIVDVYAQDDYTRLDFVHAGRLHIRTYRKRYGKRGIVTLAGRMARDISANAKLSSEL
jgi:hypothetical protein